MKNYDQGTNIVVVSSTYFPGFDGVSPDSSDNVRGMAALKTISDLNKIGIKVSIVDGGSSEEFVQQVESINPKMFLNSKNPGVMGIKDLMNILQIAETSLDNKRPMPGFIYFINQDQEGYSQARVEAIQNIITNKTGNESEIIIQMEIEKTGIVNQIKKITEPIINGDSDIVIPDRGIRVKELGDEYDNFRNYPKFQAVSERKANLLIHQMLIKSGLCDETDPVLDLFGGTRIIRNDSNLIELFFQKFSVPKNSPLWGVVKPEVHSNAVFFPIFISMFLNKKIVSVPINFSYLKEQSEVEKRNMFFAEKRQKQFDDIVGGSELLIRFLGELGKNKIFETGDQNTILKLLQEEAEKYLEGMTWNKRDYTLEEIFKHDRSGFLLNLTEKKSVVSKIEKILEYYIHNFDPSSPFLDWNELNELDNILKIIKTSIKPYETDEKINEIFRKYQFKILSNLTIANCYFHISRNSDASRNLDVANIFAEFTNTPTKEYIFAILEGTPLNKGQEEFDSLIEHFNLSEEQKKEILNDFFEKIRKKFLGTENEGHIDEVIKSFNGSSTRHQRL